MSRSHNLDANGNTPEQRAYGLTRLKLWGDFGSGTAVLQEKIDGSWVDVANGSFTEATDTLFEFPSGPTIFSRVNLSGSTSPDLNVLIESE